MQVVLHFFNFCTQYTHLSELVLLDDTLCWVQDGRLYDCSRTISVNFLCWMCSEMPLRAPGRVTR